MIPNFFHRKQTLRPYSFRDQIYYDPVAGWYVDTANGRVYPDDGLITEEGHLRVSVAEEVVFEWQSFAEELEEIVSQAYFYTANKLWKDQEKNEDVQIGQTQPHSWKNFEETDNAPTLVRVNGPANKGYPYTVVKQGISQKLPKTSIDSCIEKRSVEYTLTENICGMLIEQPNSIREITVYFCNDPRNGPKISLAPNTVEIEHRKFPQITEQELPEIPEMFESILYLIRAWKVAPNASWMKWLPVLIDFLVHNINISLPSGEISIPDLLSTFEVDRKTFKDIKNQLVDCQAENKRLRQKLKQLRAEKFGRKHTNY